MRAERMKISLSGAKTVPRNKIKKEIALRKTKRYNIVRIFNRELTYTLLCVRMCNVCLEVKQ